MNLKLRVVVNMKVTFKNAFNLINIILIMLFIILAFINGYILYMKKLELEEICKKFGPLEPMSMPGTFESIGKMVSYDELISQFKARKIRLYLPTYIPSGYKLTAIWAKVDDKTGKICFPIIVLYSKRGDTGVNSAEIGIEIYPAPFIPFRDDPNDTNDGFLRMVIANKTRRVYVDPDAYTT